MKFSVVVLGAACLLLGATELTAQAKPSFAGKWTLVPDPVGGARVGGPPAGFTIVQDAATMTLTNADETKRIIRLDGTEFKSGLPVPEAVSKARWDANKLVISSRWFVNEDARQNTISLSLDTSGRLVLESTNPGRQGGAPTTMKATYRKG